MVLGDAPKCAGEFWNHPAHKAQKEKNWEGTQMTPRAKRFFHKLLVGVFLWMSVLGSLSDSVRAEVFFDVYGGLATTGNAAVKGKEKFRPSPGGGITTTQKFREDANFKDSFTLGGRVGYWTEHFPWLGMAFDASYFKAAAKNANIDIPVVGLSGLLMMRYPLFTSEQFPRGQLKPYFGIGPDLAFTKISAEFQDNGSKKIEKRTIGVGVDIRTGLFWQFHQHWGIFTEYRFTHIGFTTKNSLNFYDDDDIDDDDIPAEGIRREDLDTTLTTHHFLAGISFRF